MMMLTAMWGWMWYCSGLPRVHSFGSDIQLNALKSCNTEGIRDTVRAQDKLYML